MELPVHKVLAVLAAAFVLAGCGGGDHSSTNPPPPPAVATVELSHQSATLKVGDILTITAVAKDASGQALTGRTATWSSSNPSVASVSGGAVSGLAPGVAEITVSIEGKTAKATITVELPGVASITVSPQRNYVQVGSTVQLTAVLRDASGSQINGRTVVWTSSDDSKATVSASGIVTGKAPGTVTISATSDGKVGTAPVTITILPSPTITDITPGTLTPGVTATITGTNFSTVASEDTVTVAGVRVTVIAASATQLTVTLPTDMPCLPTRPALVEVLTGGGPASRLHPLQVAPQRTLAVGQNLLLLDVASAKCNELVGGSRYLVSVFNTSTVPSSRTGVDISGASVSVTAPLPRAVASYTAFLPGMPSRVSAPAIPANIAAMQRLMRAAHREHLARLESDRALLRRLGPPRHRSLQRSSRTLRSTGAAPSYTTVPTTLGATTTMKYPSRGSGCLTSTNVTAKVVYSGAHTIVLEDASGPLAGQLDADYTRFGQLFDNTLYPIEDNFGDINAADADLDNPGKVIMLFTPLVNRESAGLLGFVTLCDFFDPTDPQTPASNKTKIFYARAPLRLTPQNPNSLSFDDRPTWALTMPATIVHESKHVTAFAERWYRNATTLEESWLEEATAQIAAELYGRTYWANAGFRVNARYGDATNTGTIYCEVRNLFVPANFPQCTNYTYNVTDNFFNLEEYYAAIRDKSFLSPASVDQNIYGSAWLFVRWLTDQYGAASERTFLRSLVQEASLTGVANVRAKTGKNFDELLGNFMLSLIADDYPALTLPTDAKFVIPSWSTRDMFAGLFQDFDIPKAFPLQQDSVDFGSFTLNVPAIAGGSATYLVIRGTPTPRQLINLGSLPADSPIRIHILRAQ